MVLIANPGKIPDRTPGDFGCREDFDRKEFCFLSQMPATLPPRYPVTRQESRQDSRRDPAEILATGNPASRQESRQDSRRESHLPPRIPARFPPGSRRDCSPRKETCSLQMIWKICSAFITFLLVRLWILLHLVRQKFCHRLATKSTSYLSWIVFHPGNTLTTKSAATWHCHLCVQNRIFTAQEKVVG